MFHVKHSIDDTIAAIITPIGVGGVGVIRISGPSSIYILNKLFSPIKPENDWESHKMYLGWIVDESSFSRVDEVLAVVMRSPNSYTGEDCVEIHCHGGLVVQKLVLDLILHLGGRMANPGEFSKRAFLNGKLKLSQAEAVIDLIEAKSENSLFSAVEQLSGSLSAAILTLRNNLLNVLASLEVANDFPDDMAEEGDGSPTDKISFAANEIDKLLATEDMGRMLKEGIRIAIVGKPNVGKSSLLNALLGEGRAIVTDVPGTTRDTIEESINIGGLPFIVVDTAGIRRPNDQAERFGVERARREMQMADLTLIVLDSSLALEEEDRAVITETQGLDSIIVLNKIDLQPKGGFHIPPECKKAILVSALNGRGLEELKKALFDRFRFNSVQKRDSRMVINQRQKECLLRVREALGRIAEGSMELELRTAIEALGEFDGTGITDEVINRIFSNFCVGK